MSNTQLLINQLHASIRGSLSTACKQLPKTLGLKRPAVDWLIVVYCSSVISLICICMRRKLLSNSAAAGVHQKINNLYLDVDCWFFDELQRLRYRSTTSSSLTPMQQWACTKSCNCITSSQDDAIQLKLWTNEMGSWKWWIKGFFG